MRPPVTLLMAMHCHQPVGNFDFVFEEAYAKAYEPFLGVLERHPGVKLSLHYSGCLLDWLAAHRPAFLARVRALAARGQVELLASGYGEPILPLLPEPDRQGQIGMMQDVLQRRFGERASGLWLTERVWEPDVPATLSRAGIRYTMLDVNQFAPVRAWLPSAQQMQDDAFWDVFGSYMTGFGGETVRLFPASKRLRYWMPFQPVERTLQFLARLRREQPVAVTFADDGEKFGLWPKTFQWVYESGWLDAFFSALEQERGWLSTSTFRDYANTTTPDGRVDLPCGSYDEMLEWSGGSFRNFFMKYPEASALQQKMLRVSHALQQVRQRRVRPGEARLLQRATRALYLGQCNCAYWHGVFGGLYLSHLRRAVYGQLIEAEELLARLARPAVALVAADADGDGRDEACLRTREMSLVLDPADGGAVTEWNLYGPRVNLLDTLTRRPEAYHDVLKAKRLQAAPATEGQPASIHDILGAKEEHLESYLVYDDHRRSFFLDYGLERPPTLEQAVRSTWGEGRLWSSGTFRWEPVRRRTSAAPTVHLVREQSGGWIRKAVHATGLGVECRYELEGVPVPALAIEFNLALRDERYLQPGQRAAVSRLELEEPSAGVRMRAAFDPPAMVLHFPVETVSESEGGMERTYQGLCLLCVWTPGAASTWRASVQWQAELRAPTRRPRPRTR